MTDNTQSIQTVRAIADTWARSDRQTWWWKIEDLDQANELFEAAIIELTDRTGATTLESARDARLAAIALVRANLPGHGPDELAALEPDSLAEAKNMLAFLAFAYAQLLSDVIPTTRDVEETLTATAQAITAQTIPSAHSQQDAPADKNGQNND